MIKSRADKGYYYNISAQYNLANWSPQHLLNNHWALELRTPEGYLHPDKMIATTEYLIRENAILHDRINQLTDLTKLLVSLVQDLKPAAALVHPNERVRTLMRAQSGELDETYGVGNWY